MSGALLMYLAAKLGTPNMAADIARDETYGSSGASASYSLQPTGARVLVGNLSSQADPNWLNPQIGMDQFECFASFVSGNTLSGGTLGAWLGLEGSRIWFNNVSVSGSRQTTINITIRQKGTTTPVYAANVQIEAVANTGDPP